MQIVVDGLLANYQRSGKGKVVVLLHGWGDTAATFEHFVATLRGACDVISIDLPGMGGTLAPKTAWHVGDYARFVEQFLAKLGVANVAAVIGHSNGGAIAIDMAASGTGALHINKVVLLASAGIRGERSGRKALLKAITKTGKIMSKPLPRRVKKRLRSALYAKIGSDALVLEHMHETFKNIISDDVQALAPRVKQQVLLLYGDADAITPPRYGERFATLMPHANLKIIKGAGHMLHHDKPDAVERAIVDFVL